PMDVRSGNLQLCLVPISYSAQREPGTGRPRLLHRLLRSRHLDDPRRNPSKQVRQPNHAHHWMGDEHPCPYPVLLFTKLVGRYSRADRPSIVSLQRARDERVHQHTGRSETYVVSVWSRLLRIPTGSSPLPRRRKPTPDLVECPGSILVHISSLDRFYYHPLPAKASATEGSGFEGSIVGATKVFTRANDSCIPFRRSSSLQHYVTVLPSIIPSRSASSHRCSDPASGNCPVSGNRNLCDPSRSMGCHSESRVNNSEGTHAGCGRGSWNSPSWISLLVVPIVFLL